MKKRWKILIAVIVLLVIAACILFYTRPRTIEQRYPVLDLSQCVRISGDYRNGTGEEFVSFDITPDDPHFEELIELLRSPSFRTKLYNMFPPETKTYQGSAFYWDVVLTFDDVTFPDGHTVSGDLLRVTNFFGDLELHFDGRSTFCRTSNQEQWLNDVMNVISLYSVSN